MDLIDLKWGSNMFFRSTQIDSDVRLGCKLLTGWWNSFSFASTRILWIDGYTRASKLVVEKALCYHLSRGGGIGTFGRTSTTKKSRLIWWGTASWLRWWTPELDLQHQILALLARCSWSACKLVRLSVPQLPIYKMWAIMVPWDECIWGRPHEVLYQWQLLLLTCYKCPTLSEYCMFAYKNTYTGPGVHEIRKFIVLGHWVKLPSLP